MNKSNNNSFEYSYSAPTENERREIEKIRRKYILGEDKESKLSKLRRLDKRVKSVPTMIAVVLGAGGTLLFGLGLCCVLQWELYLVGVPVGVVGIAVIALVRFVHRILREKMTKKYMPEIMKLSAELLGEESAEGATAEAISDSDSEEMKL